MPDDAIFGIPVFGSATFGQITGPVPAPTDACGGTFGSVTFGSAYFGQLIDCGDIPPVPPLPPQPQPLPNVFERIAGGGYEREFNNLPSLYDAIRERDLTDALQAQIDDEEEIAIILSVWLSIK